MLMKEIKEDTNKWKDILCTWIQIFIIIIVSMLSKAICKFNAIPAKIPMAFFFTEIETSTLNFIFSPEYLKQYLERKTKLEAPCFLISSYITKL